MGSCAFPPAFPLPLQPDPDWELNPTSFIRGPDLQVWSMRLASLVNIAHAGVGGMNGGARTDEFHAQWIVERGRQRGRKPSHTSRMFPVPPRQGWEVLWARDEQNFKTLAKFARGHLKMRVNDYPTFISCR